MEKIVVFYSVVCIDRNLNYDDCFFRRLRKKFFIKYLGSFLRKLINGVIILSIVTIIEKFFVI